MSIYTNVEEDVRSIRKIAERNMESGIAEYYSAWQDGMRARTVSCKAITMEDTGNDGDEGGKDDDDDKSEK